VHTTGVLSEHDPLPLQASPVVQSFPSSQVAPEAFGGLEQLPFAGLHVPASWHCDSGLHEIELAPVHVPPWQLLLRVQASLSSQVVSSGLLGLEHVPSFGSQVPGL
jgi:hypothetical protein